MPGNSILSVGGVDVEISDSQKLIYANFLSSLLKKMEQIKTLEVCTGPKAAPQVEDFSPCFHGLILL